MFNEIALKIEEKLAEGSNFAIAQVIDRIAPSSGKVGDKAVILDTGELIGWIGGGCVRGIVIKEALNVIKTKKYRRVRISPEGGTTETENFKQYVMACQSKGTVEVLIEPVMPQPELIVAGKSNIARKLVQLASAADFRVTVLADDMNPEMFPTAHTTYNEIDFTKCATNNNTYIIVTTQGHFDDETVKKALQTSANYVGFVASQAKSSDIRTYLKENGINETRLATLRSPVGFDINAKLAGEVAISILAEIIEHFRTRSEKIEASPKKDCCSGSKSENTVQRHDAHTTQNKTENSTFEQEYYINPVCGVPVSKTNPKHLIAYKGEKVYFCCDGCKVSFEKEPGKYIKSDDLP